MLELFESIIRTLFVLIDYLAVWAIETLYTLFVNIASTNVFGNFIYAMLGRIYLFLSVYMVFKLSLAMISYIVDPNKMTDKSKGAGKLVTNVVISLILLVTVPSIFREAYKLQGILLKENVIYQLVTGNKIVSSGTDTTGKEIAYHVYSSFIKATDGKEAYKSESKSSRCKTVTDPYCLVKVSTVTAKSDSGFVNDYQYIISNGTGIFVVYTLLVCCFDAATRAIKLGVLQIIAPVPILSLIDPKGETKQLTKWATNCGKEYAGLFLRIAFIFLAVTVISEISDPNNPYQMLYYFDSTGAIGTEKANGWVKLFVIIGLLMFAKQAPGWISDVLGFELSSGGFSLKKRFNDIPGFGFAKKTALGAAKIGGAMALGAAGGMAANTWALGNKMWRNRKHFGGTGPGAFRSLADGQTGRKAVSRVMGNLFSGAAGGISGGLRGAASKDKNMFKAAGAGIKGSVGARNARDLRQANNENIFDRAGAAIGNWAGVSNDDSAKIARKRALGDELFGKFGGDDDAKYSMGGLIAPEFGNAWRTADNAKNYRNSVNRQLSIMQNDFRAGKTVSWNGKTGSEAIAALEVESAKASAAFDKASADFKEMRSMSQYSSSTTYYEAFDAASDRASAAEYAGKTVTGYTATDPAPSSSGTSDSSSLAGKPNPNTSKKKQKSMKKQNEELRAQNHSLRQENASLKKGQ